MTEPPPLAIMCGTASCVRLNAVVTFHRSAWSNAFSVVSEEGLGHRAAGVVDDDVDAAELVHRGVDERGHAFARAEIPGDRDRPPAERLDLPRPRRRAGRRCARPMTTSAPTSAKAVAMRAPMPRPPAEMTATLPSSRKRSRITASPLPWSSLPGSSLPWSSVPGRRSMVPDRSRSVGHRRKRDRAPVNGVNYVRPVTGGWRDASAARSVRLLRHDAR